MKQQYTPWQQKPSRITGVEIDDTGLVKRNVIFDEGASDPHHKPLPPDTIIVPRWDNEIEDWTEANSDPEVVSDHKYKKDRELNNTCNKKILEGFWHTINGVNYHFSYDLEAQINFGDFKEALRDGLVTEMDWTVQTEEGEYTRVTLNEAIMKELMVAILQHKAYTISKYRGPLTNLIDEATTVEEVKKIEWDSVTIGGAAQ